MGCSSLRSGGFALFGWIEIDLYREMDTVYQDNKHYLSKSMSFSSPSAAACFVLGASANGWTEWKDKSGRTLDELFRRQAEKA